MLLEPGRFRHEAHGQCEPFLLPVPEQYVEAIHAGAFPVWSALLGCVPVLPGVPVVQRAIAAVLSFSTICVARKRLSVMSTATNALHDLNGKTSKCPERRSSSRHALGTCRLLGQIVVSDHIDANPIAAQVRKTITRFRPAAQCTERFSPQG